MALSTATRKSMTSLHTRRVPLRPRPLRSGRHSPLSLYLELARLTPSRALLDEPEETFIAGWSTASSGSEESEGEDEDDDIIYLGSKPAPSALGAAAEEEGELDFGARSLLAELADTEARASPKPAGLSQATPLQPLRYARSTVLLRVTCIS